MCHRACRARGGRVVLPYRDWNGARNIRLVFEALTKGEPRPAHLCRPRSHAARTSDSPDATTSTSEDGGGAGTHRHAATPAAAGGGAADDDDDDDGDMADHRESDAGEDFLDPMADGDGADGDGGCGGPSAALPAAPCGPGGPSGGEGETCRGWAPGGPRERARVAWCRCGLAAWRRGHVGGHGSSLRLRLAPAVGTGGAGARARVGGGCHPATSVHGGI